MSRDKFAAMASQAKKADTAGGNDSETAPQQPQQPQEPPSAPAAATPPKRDKMAALASRQQQAASPSTESPPKRDRMAALAARSGRSPTNTDGGPNASPPKRDKMAALAARSNSPQQSENPPPSATPRRNKLVALAARSSASVTNATSGPSRNNKLAKLSGSAGSNSDAAATPKSEAQIAAEAAQAREQHLAKLRERLSKRKGILDSLDRAEELTCKLLSIAAKTTDSLQDLNFSSNLADLSVAYRSTLQELHPLLTNGTEELIKPYQNHTQETKQSMYAARVEMRLAKERLEVLKTFSMLEKAEREESNTNDADETMAGDEGDRKRKR